MSFAVGFSVVVVGFDGYVGVVGCVESSGSFGSTGFSGCVVSSGSFGSTGF